MKLENTITIKLYPRDGIVNLLNSKLVIRETFMDQPDSYKQMVWLPQSIGDCIWVWIEFENLQQKNINLKYLKDCLKKKNVKLENIIVTNITQETIDDYVGNDTAKNISFDYLTGDKTIKN